MTKSQFASRAQQITAIVSLMMTLASAALIHVGRGPVWAAFLVGAAAFAVSIFVLWVHEFFGDGDHAAGYRSGNATNMAAPLYGLLLGAISAILFFVATWSTWHVVDHYISVQYLAKLFIILIVSGILLGLFPLLVIAGFCRFIKVVPKI